MDGDGDPESMGQPEEASSDEQQEEGCVCVPEASGGEEEETAYLDELWKELVEGASLWLLKCQQEGLVPEGGSEDERDHWQQFYFLSKRRRNLLRNPCGEEDLEGWCDVEHGGDGWRVEELPGDCGMEFVHDESVKKFFASSFEWCRKAQVIDLQAEGYWEELLDTTHQISHTFTDYGPGVRFVRFEHAGQDSVYWKGWFGARVTNSSVWVEP
ncbi:PREDICTED: F-box only protein 2 [Myotis davidii]|uniref:F-box only protein 2 n=1 Tax=Myotis davidii TaxID=225400 RepID=UPI000767438F|nr:PREDICTED: F-box only protein 2 [Myotis davidii]